MASLGLDQTPLDEDPIRRYVRRDDLRLAAGSVSCVARPIRVDEIVSGSAGLARLLPAFRDRQYFYVLEGDGIAGIVTRADLQLPPVSMAVLGVIISFELALTELISVYSHGSWLGALSSTRRNNLLKRFSTAQRNNAEVTELECLDLVDRFELINRLPGLRNDLEFGSNSQVRRLKERIIGIRNPLAHGGSVIGAGGKFDETLDTIEDIQEFGERAWALATNGDFIWEAYARTEIESVGPDAVLSLAAGGEAAHIITAYNPHSRYQSAEANNLANERLRSLLDETAQSTAIVNCKSPEGPWTEQSFAVGLTREKALRIARLFGQRAIFEVQGQHLRVIACECGTVRHERPFIPTSGKSPAEWWGSR